MAEPDRKAEREELERAADAALSKLGDAYAEILATQRRLAEHRVLYGTGDLSAEPVGLLPSRDAADDDGRSYGFNGVRRVNPFAR